MVLIQKTLLTEISKLGYAISYDEVKRYKQLVSMDEDHKLDHIKDGFTHFVVDNVDHNTNTLEGKGTFHGMHIIDCSIKKWNIQEKSLNKASLVPRKRCSFFFKIILTPLHNTKEKTAVFTTVLNLGFLWHESRIFHKKSSINDVPLKIFRFQPPALPPSSRYVLNVSPSPTGRD